MTFILRTTGPFDGAISPHPDAYRNRWGEWAVDFWEWESFLDFLRSVGEAQITYSNDAGGETWVIELPAQEQGYTYCNPSPSVLD